MNTAVFVTATATAPTIVNEPFTQLNSAERNLVASGYLSSSTNYHGNVMMRMRQDAAIEETL